jgi:hypothetical protein
MRVSRPFRLPVPEYPTLLRLHSPLIEPDVRICRIRLSDRIRCTAHGQPGLPFAGELVPSATAESAMEVIGNTATLRILGRFHNVPEARPLPSPSVTRLRRYYGPLRLPRQPGLSVAGVRLAHAATTWGLPCCVRSPCADMLAPTTPARPWPGWCSPSWPRRRPSPNVRRVGSRN